MVDSYVAIDLETTGLYPKRDRILEIGAIKVVAGEIVAKMSFLVNPYREIPEQVTKLTGICDEDVAVGVDIEEALPQIIDFTAGFPLLGHNVLFDYSFLKRFAINQALEFERDGIDTYKLTKKLLPQLEKKNLKAACGYFQIELDNAHRALADATAAHLLYQALKKQFESEYNQIFVAKPLIFKVKKEQPATKSQKQYLIDLVKYHKIEISVQVDYLTRNEASRITDKIIFKYGRMNKKR